LKSPFSGKFKSVRVRLTLWNVCVLTIALIGVAIQIRMSVRANLIHSIDGELNGMARFAARGMRRAWGFGGNGFGAASRPNGQRSIGDSLNANVRRLDDGIGVRASNFPSQQPFSPPPAAQNQPQPPSPAPANTNNRRELTNVPSTRIFVNGPRTVLNEVPWDLAAYNRANSDGADVYSNMSSPTGRTVRVLTRPVRASGSQTYIIQSTFPLAEMERAMHSLDITLLTIIPLVLAIAGGGGAFLTARALSPVRQITKAADSISAQDLSLRLPVASDDEFADLSRTFNAMLTRLEASFQEQRRFTSDASHELKSPLTIIKANTGLALRTERDPEEYVKRLHAIDRAANHMRGLVDDLLLLARYDESRLAAEKKPVELRSLALETVELVSQPGAAQVSVTESNEQEEEPIFALGTRNELLRVLKNLLENAVQHTPANGSITLSVTASAESGIIRIRDTGEGISPEHLPHLCERFYRVDTSRARTHGGTGLGLAICKSIVEAHNGAIYFESKPGAGTTVTVSLPRAHPVGN
jgi:two-component system, OmpR family, sensor kinase